ncbi:MAG: hypothetical protein ACYS47_20320, partial [Planctomycetota bacterium]
ILAVLGFLVPLAVGAAQSTSIPRAGTAFVILVVLGFATFLIMGFLFSGAVNDLQRNLDLLVPLGVALLLSSAVSWLSLAPGLASLLAPTKTLKLLGITLTVSVAFFLHILLWTAYAAWQTDLIWRWVRDERPGDLDPGKPVQSHFFRALGVLVLGYVVLFAAMIPIIAVSRGAMVFALFLIAGLSVAWNVLTVALLPVVVMRAAPFVEALGEGFRMSWALKHCWILQLLAQLVLLGIFVVVSVSYTESSLGGFHRQSTRNYNVHASWVGGYSDDDHWHGDYMKALKSKPVPFVSAVFTLLFTCLAVCMKLHVTRELWDALRPPPEPEEFLAEIERGPPGDHEDREEYGNHEGHEEREERRNHEGHEGEFPIL